MQSGANVRSVEVVEELKAAVANYCEKTVGALSEVEMEIRRKMDEIIGQRMQYWRAQLQKANDAIAQARSDIARKRLGAMEGSHPDLVEEKKALQRAQQHLLTAEQKIAAIKRWGPQLERAANEYRSIARRLIDLVEGQPPVVLQPLNQALINLERYLQVQAPTMQPDPNDIARSANESAPPSSFSTTPPPTEPAEPTNEPPATDETLDHSTSS